MTLGYVEGSSKVKADYALPEAMLVWHGVPDVGGAVQAWLKLAAKTTNPLPFRPHRLRSHYKRIDKAEHPMPGRVYVSQEPVTAAMYTSVGKHLDGLLLGVRLNAGARVVPDHACMMSAVLDAALAADVSRRTDNVLRPQDLRLPRSCADAPYPWTDNTTYELLAAMQKYAPRETAALLRAKPGGSDWKVPARAVVDRLYAQRLPVELVLDWLARTGSWSVRPEDAHVTIIFRVKETRLDRRRPLPIRTRAQVWLATHDESEAVVWHYRD